MQRVRRSAALAVVGAVVIVAVLAIVLAAILGAFNSSAAKPGPGRVTQTVLRIPPTPSARRVGGACGPQQWSPAVTGTTGGGTITVDQDPIGATVFWMPGLNSRDCRVESSKLSAAQANSLATTIRHTNSFRGPIACPMDDASAAWIFFVYPGRTTLDVVEVDLSGCNAVSAPHRDAAGPARPVAELLRGLEPPGWAA